MSESSSINLQALRDSNTDFSSEVCKILKNTLFYRLPAAASVGLRFPACNFVKKETPVKMFFCEFYKIFKNIFWQNTCGCLLLVFIWEFWEIFQNTSFIVHLIYINDLHEAIRYCKVHHFADDTDLFHTKKSVKNLNKLLSHNMKELKN